MEYRRADAVSEGRVRIVGVSLVAAGLLAAHGCGGHVDSAARVDGGSAIDGGGPVAPDASCGPTKPAGPPLQHRTTAVACGLSAPFPNASSCTSDAGCGTIPVQQTCLPYPDAGGAAFCNSDQCFTDSDCKKSGGPCGCSVSTQQLGIHNLCYEGNCQTDTDCGAGGYCSPSPDTYCNHLGSPPVYDYYCHTPKDECTNDSDCASCGAGAYCAVTSAGFWQCVQPSQLPQCPSG